jgi:hypothetical protein
MTLILPHGDTPDPAGHGGQPTRRPKAASTDDAARRRW